MSAAEAHADSGHGDPRSDDEVTWSVIRPIIGFVAGANIVMQLSRLGVGRGVAESTVESGRLDKHPIKRARTTFTYVLVAVLGSERERAWLRTEIDRSHRAVRNSPDDPVRYSAFDPDLQLWVAACICKGALDAALTLDPGIDDETRGRIIRLMGPVATTLQVSPESWPADSDAFDRYLAQGLERLEADDVTRAYLHDFLRLRWLGRIPSAVLGRVHMLVSTGFLSEEFHRTIGLQWSDDHQRRFERLMRVVVAIDRRVPQPIVRLAPTLYLWDFRRRHRRGRHFT